MNETIIQFVIGNASTIPLEITQSTRTNWTQFALTMAVSALAFIWILGNSIGSSITFGISKIRIKLFKRINKIKHLMIIKHTKSGLFEMSMIDQTTMKDIQEALMKFKGEDFDLILYTGGGEIFSSEYISRLFRHYKGKIRTFVPVYSMSGGTYLALSTNELYMNDYACLGGIDPQLGNLFSYGSAKGWKEVLRLKKGKANDQSIIMNLMGKQYTKTMKKNINELLIKKLPDKNQRNEFVDYLTSGEIQHALPLTKSTLRSFGLKIGDIDEKTNIKLLKLIKNIGDGVIYG